MEQNMINNRGKNLIFLISQPRAGSTMTQKILGSHSDVHTTSEPWLMLHPMYSLKKSGIYTEYSSKLAEIALENLLSQIENGFEIYLEEIRNMYSSIYSKLLKTTGKTFFLDKTPRYYFIINELYNCFPDSKIIILIRNPLSVLSSIINTWIHDDWYKLSDFRYDLMYAPDLLIKGIEKLDDKVMCIQYEEIIVNPEIEIKKICNFIGLDFQNKMIEYGKNQLPKWSYGDQGAVYKKIKPDAEHKEKWIKNINNSQTWRVMKDYLDYLGKDRIKRLGYSFEKFEKILIKNKPKSGIKNKTTSLYELLYSKKDELFDVSPFNKKSKKRFKEFILRSIKRIRKLYKRTVDYVRTLYSRIIYWHH